jgi:hypothetical protein
MKVNKYGKEPSVIGQFNLVPEEMCFVQYLPIAMAGKDGLGEQVFVPENLSWVWPIIHAAQARESGFGIEDYVYLTVKHLYVTPSNMGNRPGWHSDGFGTDDINYIWCDQYPTEFCIQDFSITEDCETSLKEMEDQARVLNIKTYGENTLLRLDKYNIHRTPVIGEGYRTFVKISISKNRYNLKGNAHNYLFDYDWEMMLRSDIRNHPSK